MAKSGAKGKVVQVIGPVVDAAFDQEDLPNVFDALEIPLDDGGRLVCEVQGQSGEGWVRAVAMSSTDGLRRGMDIIGTGGIFRYGLHPERVLQAALFSPETPWSLKPRAPKTFINRDYMLYGIGLLAADHPVQALRIAKKCLRT